MIFHTAGKKYFIEKVMLELATRQNNHIKNRTGVAGQSQQQMAKFAGFVFKFPHARKRSENTDMYNCHGMVFACRRTNIDDSNEVQKIIVEDDYIQVRNENVLPGDIIIYFSIDGDAEHSGIVISEPNNHFLIPLVLSKWGQLEEYIHYANQCPYNFANAKYYRLRI
jgi:hypothetical protein